MAIGPALHQAAVLVVSRGVQSDSVAAGADEVEDLLHDRVLAEFLADVLDPLGKRALVGEKQPIGAAQVVDLLAAEAAAAQPDDVETGEIGAVAEQPCRRE